MINLVFMIIGIVIMILSVLCRKRLWGWEIVFGINALSVIINGIAVYLQYIVI